MVQSQRIAERDDRLPFSHFIGIAQRDWRESARVDANHGQIERTVRGVNGFDFVAFAIGHLHGDRPTLADDVQIGGDQTIGGDDKSASQPMLPAISPGDGDHGQARARGGTRPRRRLAWDRRSWRSRVLFLICIGDGYWRSCAARRGFVGDRT